MKQAGVSELDGGFRHSRVYLDTRCANLYNIQFPVPCLEGACQKFLVFSPGLLYKVPAPTRINIDMSMNLMIALGVVVAIIVAHKLLAK